MSRAWQGALVLGLLLVLLSPAEAAFFIRGREVAGVRRVYVEDVARYYGLKMVTEDKTTILFSDIRRVDLTLDRREARVNLLTVHFFFAPVVDDGDLLISEKDLALILDPIFRSWALPKQPVKRICLDPGHGGHDSGALGAKLKEKDLALEIAQRTRKLLVSQGYEVMLTREDDTFIPLAERAAKAIAWKADLFIAIHFNAAANTSVSGIETFVVTPLGAPTTYHTEVETRAVPGNRFDTLNARLGFEMQRYLIARTQAVDRGVKHGRLLVLVQAGMPAVLLELGFVSTPDEERLIGDATYQHRLALGIASGVIAMDRSLNAPPP